MLQTLQKIYLCLRPKELQGDDGARQPGQANEHIVAELAKAEQIMNAIGGLRVPKDRLLCTVERTDHVVFEILARGDTISFYIVIPDQLNSYLQQHLRSSYPDIELVEEKDYNLFLPDGAIAATNLKLKGPNYLPIKTYRQMEIDPLEGILGVLGKLAPEESAVIQVVARSAVGKWHKEGIKATSKIKAGKGLLGKTGKASLMSQATQILQAGW